MRRRLGLGRLALLLLASAAARGGDSPLITAERLGQAGGAKTEIFAVGFAHYSSRKDYFTEESHLIAVTPAQIRNVADVIKRQEVCSLPRQIKPEGPVLPDTSFFSITVHLPGTECEVTGGDFDQVKDRSVAKRFLAAWNAITGVVPEAER